jgi:hypothetical protein
VDVLIVVLRLLHIVCGALWVGFAVFTAFYLLPAVTDTGPDGGKVVAALQRRGLLTILPILALGTILPGLWLYWHVSGGFSGPFMRSRFGMAIGTGAAVALVAYVIGMTVSRPVMGRIGTLMQSMATMTDDKARQAAMQEIGRLRARAALAGRVVGWMLLFAVGAMAVARYL